jgi:hypothetical protein
MLHDCAAKHCMPQPGRGQVCIFTIGVPKISGKKIRISQAGTTQISLVEISAVEIGTAQIRNHLSIILSPPTPDRFSLA